MATHQDRLEALVSAVGIDVKNLTNAKNNAGHLDKSKLSLWYSSAPRSYAGRMNMLAIGDSITEGTTLSNQEYEAWPMVLGKMMTLAANGQPGGMGYVPAAFANGLTAWTLVGSPTISTNSASYRGLGRRFVILGASQSASYSFYGTNYALYYSKVPGGGNFTVTVDGTVVGTVSTDATPEVNTARYVPATLARGNHTVTITRVTGGAGGTVSFEGGTFWDNDYLTGVTAWNGAHTGITAEFLVGSVDKERWATAVESIHPALVFIALGTNDSGTVESPGVYTPTIFGERIRSIINLVRAHSAVVPQFVLLKQPKPLARDTTYWNRHMAALDAVANTESNVVTLDLSLVIPPGPATGTNTLYNDALHPSAVGHRLYAREIARQLEIIGPTESSAPMILTGSVEIAWTSASSSAAASKVTFPPGFFTNPPMIMLSRAASATTAPKANAYPAATTAVDTLIGMSTGDAAITYPTGTKVVINWTAIAQ